MFNLNFDRYKSAVQRAIGKPSVTRFKCLEEAIKRNQLTLHYQPKVDMYTGTTIGVEALLRWNHPQLGLLTPAMFAQAMHDDFSGVLNIGHWAIHKSIDQISAWGQEGLTMPISVNVLAAELTEGDFCSWLADLFAQHADVPPSLIELEIVESSTICNIDKVIQVVTACRKIGVKVALDDFGTGYSSLAHVRNLPADHVKIDQSFVKNLHFNHQDRDLVGIVIQLAHTFHCKVIAEGVETIEHGCVLIRLGCRYAQGYAIARPMQASEFPRWNKEYKSVPEWEEIGRISMRSECNR